ncbi:DUF2785 domain-containing protein [Lacticaseibacillus paracasei subsp. tolerans]|uniref:DUF2785 domain-containing protein n=1 Tax=Lacticaseibacillus paracasei TaxID=1597 RepID=UPI001892AE0B|nr:DUF2785 domain-containing protein [Lacticaseibacillus paracasei]QPC18378.1 DUF2785 domain-containing protein [Lacticaseibacillus paracasei subsp. tolerans]
MFTRTFTALLKVILLETDSSKPFLTDKQIQTWIDWILKYLQVETDWRGYVSIKRLGAWHSLPMAVICLQRQPLILR